MKFTVAAEDRDEALELLRAPEAWSALRRIDNISRNQLKHEAGDDRQIIEQLRATALEALRGLE